MGCVVTIEQVESCKTQLVVAFYDGRFWLEARAARNGYLDAAVHFDMPNAGRIACIAVMPRQHLFPFLCSNSWCVDSEPMNASNAMRRREEQGRVAYLWQ